MCLMNERVNVDEMYEKRYTVQIFKKYFSKEASCAPKAALI